MLKNTVKSLHPIRNIYVGTAGWNYKDWEGIVYPSQKEKNFDHLAYLATLINVIEINSSFYRPPAVQATLKWIDRVKHNAKFTFTYKLWQAYTHERESFPDSPKEKMVKQGLDVLKKNNRLGAVLVQFPWSFKNTPENHKWLEKVIGLFREYNPVIEVRHNSWNKPDFFSFLNDSGAAYANIDQPVIGDSIGLTSFGSEKFSYLRLHGRNFKNWFAKDANVASRYDYLYNDEELRDITETISGMIENSPKTYIIFNNHYRGQAIVNALQSIFLLDGNKVEAPKSLVEYYPFLENISKISNENIGQTSLF